MGLESSEWCQANKRQWEQTETQEVHLNMKKSYCACNQALEGNAQRSYVVCFPEDIIQKLSGHNPG